MNKNMNSDFSCLREMQKNMAMNPPIFKSAKRAITSNSTKAAAKAIANQLVGSGANIATDALMGNDVSESLKRELQAGQQNAVDGVQKLKRVMKSKANEKIYKKINVMDLILKSLSENLMILQSIMGMVEDLKDISRKEKTRIFRLPDGSIMKCE